MSYIIKINEEEREKNHSKSAHNSYLLVEMEQRLPAAVELLEEIVHKLQGKLFTNNLQSKTKNINIEHPYSVIEIKTF